MEWQLPRGTAHRLLSPVKDVDDLFTHTDDIITSLVSPIGEALSSDFGRNPTAH